MTDGDPPPRSLSQREMRSLAVARGRGRCEFCRMVKLFQGSTYHIDHITPTSRGGVSRVENYSWLCWACNTAKTDRVNCFDPQTDAEVEMFNPRTMVWGDHFAWRGWELIGLTPVGRGLIHTLELNAAWRVPIRRMEQDQGEFPPPVA